MDIQTITFREMQITTKCNIDTYLQMAKIKKIATKLHAGKDMEKLINWRGEYKTV